MYGQPVMQQQVYGQPMGMQQTVTTQYTTVPQQYARVQYQWQGGYDRRMPFMLPFGVDQYSGELMMYASTIFREADADYNGVMTYNEFVMVMAYLGYNMYPQEAERLFYMIDTDRSGFIDEREFVAYWVYAVQSGGFRFDLNQHRMSRGPMNIRFAGRGMGMGMGMGGGGGYMPGMGGGMPMGGMGVGHPGMGVGMGPMGMGGGYVSKKQFKRSRKNYKKAYKHGYHY